VTLPTEGHLAGMSDEALYNSIAATKNRLTMEKAQLSLLEIELTKRQGKTAAQLFEAAGKRYGQASYTDDAGRKFKAEIKRTVTWDSAKLQAVAATMTWEQAQRIFDIKFAVPENTFKAIIDDELIGKLAAARTTKYGDLSVSLVPDDGKGDRQ
jgi:hypothetical protein